MKVNKDFVKGDKLKNDIHGNFHFATYTWW